MRNSVAVLLVYVNLLPKITAKRNPLHTIYCLIFALCYLGQTFQDYLKKGFVCVAEPLQKYDRFKKILKRAHAKFRIIDRLSHPYATFRIL